MGIIIYYLNTANYIQYKTFFLILCYNMIISLSIKSVSYTHLEETIMPQRENPPMVENDTIESQTDDSTEEDRDLVEAEEHDASQEDDELTEAQENNSEDDSPEAVSYTHLDVYKRQGLYFVLSCFFYIGLRL